MNSESSTSIRVEWDPPREDFQFGIIRSYIVLYRVTETGSAMVMNVVNRSLIIESLMEFTNYSVEVAAVTVGEGPYSDPVTVVTDQDSKLFLMLIIILSLPLQFLELSPGHQIINPYYHLSRPMFPGLHLLTQMVSSLSTL